MMVVVYMVIMMGMEEIVLEHVVEQLFQIIVVNVKEITQLVVMV